MRLKQRTTAEQTSCRVCGLPHERWFSEGYERNGASYCCKVCAEAKGCLCVSDAQMNYAVAAPHAHTHAHRR